jgi:uncharacterized membrane protein YqgA involved in biofilm formation
MRGTVLNTATVAAGASLGMLVGAHVPPSYQEVAMSGLGLCVAAIGVKMFLQSKNAVVVLAAIALGGVVGTALGISGGLENLSEWARQRLGGGSHFNEGFITCSVLFCVGPLTLLGCIQDGIEGNIELLTVKSALDGIAAFFFAAALGAGVLVSALFVLVFQGLITVLARQLKPIAKDEDIIAAATGTGGIMMMAIALSVLSVKKMPVADYIPALILGPLFAVAARKLTVARKRVGGDEWEPEQWTRGNEGR